MYSNQSHCRPAVPVSGLPQHFPAHVPRVHRRGDGARGSEASVLRAVPAGDGTRAAA